MNTVQTEQQLAKITERRTWARPGLVAFAGAAAVVLLIGAALLTLRPADPAETVPPATGLTAPPTTATETTPPPSTSGPVETTTTTPAVSLPALDKGMVVLAEPGPGGFAATSLGADTVAVNADLAISDGGDGLVVEAGEMVAWVRPGLPAVELFSAADFGGDTLRLQDHAIVDGEDNVVFIVAGGVEEQRYEQVWRHQLSDGTQEMLYETGAYEGTVTRVSLQSDILVITRHAEGFSWFEFFNSDGEPIDVLNPKSDAAEFPVFVDQGLLSPDGATLVYVESDSPAPPEDNNWRIDLIVWDLANGRADRRMEIELGNWLVDRMDFDGSGLVIGRIQWDGQAWGSGPALRVNSLDPDAGMVSEYPVAGLPSLIK